MGRFSKVKRHGKGTVLYRLGYGMTVVAIVLVMAPIFVGEETARVLYPLAAAFLVAGLLALLRGERMSTLTAAEVLADDQRPPVVYLRSFEDEIGDHRVSLYLRLVIRGRWRACRFSRSRGWATASCAAIICRPWFFLRRRHSRS